MKRAACHTLISLLFCVCTAFTQADGVLRSLSCPWWKTGSPYALCGHDSDAGCCSSAVETEGFPGVSFHDFGQQSEAPTDDGCCNRGCCKSFQSMIFLTTEPPVSIRTDNFPPVFEKNHSLPWTDFSKSLFRPPQV